MKDTDYCYVHSFGRFSKIPWWKNITIHFIIAVVGIVVTTVGTSLGWLSYFNGPSLSKQEEVIAIGKDSMKGIENIQELIHRVEQTNYYKLIHNYPEGYVLFAIDYKGIVTPSKSRLHSKFEIDLNLARITEFDTKKITIALPEIRNKRTKGIITENELVIFRTVGPAQSPLAFEELVITPEVLYDNKKEIICVLGFKEREL